MEEGAPWWQAWFQEERWWENRQKQQSSIANDYFRGVGFCIGREGTKLYVKTLEQLGLYNSTQFKNGSDVK